MLQSGRIPLAYSPHPLVFTHVVNFYMAPNKPSLFASVEAQDAYKRAVELQARIVDIAVSDSPDSTALLEGYAREALRKLISIARVP